MVFFSFFFRLDTQKLGNDRKYEKLMDFIRVFKVYFVEIIELKLIRLLY